jgi:hypothetical protein
MRFQFLQFRFLIAHGRQLAPQKVPNFGTGVGMFILKDKKLPNLFEREAEIFRPLYKCQPFDGSLGKLPVAGGRSRRRRQQSLALIEADRFQIYCSAVRELASCQAIHVARIDPVVIYRVKAGVKAGQRTCSAQRAEQGKQALVRYCRVSSQC